MALSKSYGIEILEQFARENFSDNFDAVLG
jgi:hypothetical protein